MALTVGSRLGHYQVSALIGEGGMGQVYQASDTKLNRQVALKVLQAAGFIGLIAGPPGRYEHRVVRCAGALSGAPH